jgi:hypothetical protein
MVCIPNYNKSFKIPVWTPQYESQVLRIYIMLSVILFLMFSLSLFNCHSQCATILTLHELNDSEVRSVLADDTTKQLCYFVNQLEN